VEKILIARIAERFVICASISRRRSDRFGPSAYPNSVVSASHMSREFVLNDKKNPGRRRHSVYAVT
jgi:hypothetical protein